MPTSNAQAKWEGTLQQGKGTMSVGSGAFEGAYSFGTRFEDAPGTNPEELIGAARAGCGLFRWPYRCCSKKPATHPGRSKPGLR